MDFYDVIFQYILQVEVQKMWCSSPFVVFWLNEWKLRKSMLTQDQLHSVHSKITSEANKHSCRNEDTIDSWWQKEVI